MTQKNLSLSGVLTDRPREPFQIRGNHLFQMTVRQLDFLQQDTPQHRNILVLSCKEPEVKRG